MPTVLGRGWIEAAVPTLHCSSLDSVFLSPIYTLSVQQAALQPVELSPDSLSLHPQHTSLPPAHFSPPVPRPTSHLHPSRAPFPGRRPLPPPHHISQFTPPLGPEALDKLINISKALVCHLLRKQELSFFAGQNNSKINAVGTGDGRGLRIIQVTQARRGISYWPVFPSRHTSWVLCPFDFLLSRSPKSVLTPFPHFDQPRTALPSLEGAPLIPSLQGEISPTLVSHSPDSPLILSSKGGCGGAKFIEKRLGRQERGL